MFCLKCVIKKRRIIRERECGIPVCKRSKNSPGLHREISSTTELDYSSSATSTSGNNNNISIGASYQVVT